MSPDCQSLDAFFTGDPSAEGYERFESHLAVCDACRVAVNQQRWIDGLLRSTERFDIEPVSPALGESVRNTIVLGRRQARSIACSLTAAAVLVIAVGWTVLNRQSKVSAINQSAQTAVRDSEPSPSPSLRGRGKTEPPRAVFVGAPDVLAVPIASRHPNVTIVRVYPTYQPTLASQDSGDESDADYFNGG